MFNSLWDQLKSRLHPCEIEEALYFLTPNRIERNEDLCSEIKNLLELFDEIPSRFKDLSTHKHKVDFYLSKLSTKAQELGIQPTDLIPLKTPRDKHIYDFLSDGGSTRPHTAESSSTPAPLIPNDIDLGFIEKHKQELTEALDKEYDFLKARADAIQKDLLQQATMPTAKEVNDLTKKLEVKKHIGSCS